MSRKSYRDAIHDALREEMLRDRRVLIMGEEVGVGGGTYAVSRSLYTEFGEKRIIDTPIAEAAIIGTAVGAAMGGLRPVAELMTINFCLVAMAHPPAPAPADKDKEGKTAADRTADESHVVGGPSRFRWSAGSPFPTGVEKAVGSSLNLLTDQAVPRPGR